ncbi:natterin-4-like [Denticeps clupeoides]|uniref:natterin-4-like n=1 Tax=Denticeps clupeoides TaxID=299321 RepID=UPI0010A2C792|nr:natterin-4-like [Denticeps clupeoides]
MIRRRAKHFIFYVVGSQAAFLVNKDNFEILEWKTNEYSKIPSLSVETCNGIFIIRNENGIGYLSTGKGGVESKLELSGEVSLSLSYSSSTSDKSVHSVSMTVDVPPNHMCNMKITGNSIVTNVPFTGVITRTFKNKEVRTTSVSGTFNAQEVGEIRAIVDRCQPVPDPQPCSE